MLDKIPPSLRRPLRRLILKARIPLYRVLAYCRCRFRKLVRWRTADPVPWRLMDLSDQRGENLRLFCLSLLDMPKYQVRRDLFQSYARKHGWPVEFWPAINGAQQQNFPEWVTTGSRSTSSAKLGLGEAGLLLTVKDLYEWAWGEGLDYLVVFEDDAVIHASPVVEIPREFDIVFFNDRFHGDRRGRVRGGWGNDGYLISRRGLQKMLEILNHATEPIDLLIMMYTRSLEEYGHYITRHRDPRMPQLDCYHIGPLVSHAGFFESSIGLISRANFWEE